MNPPLTLNKIVEVLKDELPYLKEKYKVESISLFGSYVRNEQTSISDLDLLVTFTETPGFIKFVNLENYLSDELGIEVDLVMKDALKTNISTRIKEEAIAL
ncbi:MAG TPA: nucleotidyltransferase family protein [Balneolaceae bacterium]|nr:nucleotidyltransferase family protein [Balneolaceae bacterium]